MELVIVSRITFSHNPLWQVVHRYTIFERWDSCRLVNSLVSQCCCSQHDCKHMNEAKIVERSKVVCGFLSVYLGFFVGLLVFFWRRDLCASGTGLF